MKYIIVMPAFNEAENIGPTLDSIAAQEIRPSQLIVVNDGSTDQTSEIVQSYASKYPWIKLIENPGEARHAPGGKIVKAFYKGFNQITQPYDVIVKLDADLLLPINYFAEILRMFQEQEDLGIAGGINLVLRNGNWVYENFADDDHVRGAFKAYRKPCFEAIGGLRPSVGWDTADELIAMYHGWKTKTNKDLVLKHVRARGKSTGFVRVMKKIGHAMYRLRYGFLITLISAAKAGFVNRPMVITGFAVMLGFIEAYFRSDPFIVTEEEGRFIRNFRIKRMKEKLGRKG